MICVRKILVRAPLLLVALIALVACNSPTDPSPTEAEPTSDIRYLPASWVLRSQKAAQLEIGVFIDGCVEYGWIDVIETERYVEILAWVQFSLASRTKGCFPSAGYEHVEVMLENPVGNRVLLGCRIEETDPPPQDGPESCDQIVP